MSFGFYDGVQTGQLISRANSDIRSVQMYLTFAPAIIVQCAVGVVAFGYMLSINVPLAFVAMSTIPFVFVLSVRMRKRMFPVSWLIQARLAEVATIVDENINGVLTTAMKADRIVVVDQGQIVETGSHAELVARGGRYAEMYATWTSHSEGRDDRARTW